MVRLFIILLSLFALSACGGGGTSISKAEIITKRPDGTGTVRGYLQTPYGNVTTILLTADVDSEVAALNAHDGTQVADLRSISYWKSDTYSDYYTAQAVIGGELTDVTILYNKIEATTFAYYGESTSANGAAVAGLQATNLPSGLHVYSGSNVVANRDGSNMEFGTFTMGVNFDTKTASINGSTNSTSLDATGMSVNTSSGTFHTNSATYRVNDSASNATVTGLFHGNGATSVTGVYYPSGNNPATSGAIIGNR